jgi:hypothetical protein
VTRKLRKLDEEDGKFRDKGARSRWMARRCGLLSEEEEVVVYCSGSRWLEAMWQADKLVSPGVEEKEDKGLGGLCVVPAATARTSGALWNTMME